MKPSVHSIQRLSLLLFSVAVFFLLSSCRKEEHGTASHKVPARVGEQAPLFVLKDLSGKEIGLSQYRGKVVLLEFWTTWCPPCRASIPDLLELQRTFSSADMVILSILMDAGGDIPGKLASFQREYNITYPILLGTRDISDAYNVRSIPALFLIDKQGIIEEIFVGYADGFMQRISERIRKLL